MQEQADRSVHMHTNWVKNVFKNQSKNWVKNGFKNRFKNRVKNPSKNHCFMVFADTELLQYGATHGAKHGAKRGTSFGSTDVGHGATYIKHESQACGDNLAGTMAQINVTLHFAACAPWTMST